MCWIQKFVLVPAQGQPGLTSGTSKIRAGSSTSGSSKRHCRTAKVCPVSYQYGKSMTSVIPVWHKVCPVSYQYGKSMPSAIPERHKVCSVSYQNGKSMPSAIPERHKVCPVSYQYGKSMLSAIPERHKVCPVSYQNGTFSTNQIQTFFKLNFVLSLCSCCSFHTIFISLLSPPLISLISSFSPFSSFDSSTF